MPVRVCVSDGVGHCLSKGVWLVLTLWCKMWLLQVWWEVWWWMSHASRACLTRSRELRVGSFA